jgi:hypothetical protein
MDKSLDKSLDKIYQNIEFFNKDALINDLNDLNIFILSNNESETLITKLLQYSFKNINIDSVRVIIQIFDNERVKVDILPALTNLFLNQYIETNILIFVLACFPEKTAFNYLLDLVNMSNDIEAVYVARKICDIYNDISSDDWFQLVELTENFEDEEYPNLELRQFFIENATHSIDGTKCHILPVDEIIIDDIKYKTLTNPKRDNLPNATHPVESGFTPILPKVVDVVEIMFENMMMFLSYKHTKDVEVIKNGLMIQYSMSSFIDKIKMLKSLNNTELNKELKFDDIDELEKLDKELNCSFGVVNTMYYPIEDKNHVCVKYGGCRMFLCSHFEEINHDGVKIDIFDDDDIEVNWYRCKCDFCDKKILSKNKAIRQPLLYGGWKGCYCSMPCMERHMDKTNQNTIMLEILNNVK